MKKIPLIGLLIGAIAAMFAMKKGRHHEEAEAPAEDSSD